MKKQFTVYLPENLNRQVRFLAVEKNTSMTDITTKALRQYLASQEQRSNNKTDN